MKEKKTIKGPRDVELVLDPAQIYPEDPGQGTPAMVYYKGGSATFSCAANEGEVLDQWGFTIELPKEAVGWLQTIGQDLEDDMYNSWDEEHTDGVT